MTSTGGIVTVEMRLGVYTTSPINQEGQGSKQLDIDYVVVWCVEWECFAVTRAGLTRLDAVDRDVTVTEPRLLTWYKVHSSLSNFLST